MFGRQHVGVVRRSK